MTQQLVEWLIGVGASLAACAAGAMYVVSVILRERRGPEAQLHTLSSTRPLFTISWLLIITAGVLVLILRLGVMS